MSSFVLGDFVCFVGNGPERSTESDTRHRACGEPVGPKQGRPKAEKVNLEARYRYRDCPVSIPVGQFGNRTPGYRYRTSPVSIPRAL